MPSILVGNPAASGGQSLFGSGLLTSGSFPVASGRQNQWPIGGFQLRHDPLGNSGGVIFIAFSGNMTINSGNFMLSGGVNSGLIDGMPLSPGDAMWIPRSAVPLSGFFNIYALPNTQASGQRLYWEAF